MFLANSKAFANKKKSTENKALVLVIIIDVGVIYKSLGMTLLILRHLITGKQILKSGGYLGLQTLF